MLCGCPLLDLWQLGHAQVSGPPIPAPGGRASTAGYGPHWGLWVPRDSRRAKLGGVRGANDSKNNFKKINRWIKLNTDIIWIFPVFPLRSFLLQDPIQVTTWQEIIVTPLSPPPTSVSPCLPLAFMTSKVSTIEVKYFRGFFHSYSFPNPTLE